MSTTIRQVRRRGVLAIVVTATLLAVPASATAAPLKNDDISKPTALGALPASARQDTTRATTGPTDPPFCFGGDSDSNTVWYSLTAAASGRLAVDTFGSDYDTTLYVGTADGAGGMDVIDCVDDTVDLQSRVAWDAVAGTTYLIMAGTCCGDPGSDGGGDLRLHADVAMPAVTATVTIDDAGKHTKAGTAIVSGTITCSGDGFVDLFAEVRQTLGRRAITGDSGIGLDCGPDPIAWQVEVSSIDGSYGGGNATVTATAFVCDQFECTASDPVSRRIKLGVA